MHPLRLALCSVVCALALPASAVAAPSNDAFANATAVSASDTVGAVLGGQTIDGATSEANELAPPGAQTVWYRWVPSYTGIATVDVCQADFPVTVGVYTGTNVSSLTSAAAGAFAGCYAPSRGAIENAAVSAGQPLYVQVTSFATPISGTHFTLRVNKPHNDNLIDADPLGDSFGVVTAPLGATKEAGEPAHANDAGGHSLWFSWTSGAAGPAKFSTCWFNTGFDTLLAAYSGSSYPLNPIAQNDDSSTCQSNSRASAITFDAAAHTTYRIALDSFHTVTPQQLAAGSFLLYPPRDDQLADAFPINGSRWTGAWGYMATKEPGEPDHAGVPGGASVWWKWTAAQSGPVTFDTCTQYDDSPDTALAVYTGDAYPLTPVAANDDTTRCGKGKSSLVTFDAVAGTNYKIAGDVKGGAGEAMVLNADVPSNDFFEHAAPLSGSGAVDADTGLASAEPGEPAHAGIKAVSSLWWTYTAPADGTVHLDTCASTEFDDTTLAVYTGAALDALTPVASDDDADGCPDRRSSVDFQATAGTTYRIAADSKTGGSHIRLTFSGPGAPAPAPGGDQHQPSGPGPILGKVTYGRARIGRLVRGRFVVKAECLRACSATSVMRAHGRVVGAGVAATDGPRTLKLRVRVPVRKRAALRSRRSLRATVVVTAIDPQTHVIGKRQRTIRFRR